MPFGWVCFSNDNPDKAQVITNPGVSQLPFGWVCFSNPGPANLSTGPARRSQLPFGWVCFSNETVLFGPPDLSALSLNCLSAGSVSLTLLRRQQPAHQAAKGLNCLSAGSVSLTRITLGRTRSPKRSCLNCLSAGSVSLTFATIAGKRISGRCVSIAFRLGLFL